MADQTARIEALLATLSDDSSVAVENALRIYEPSEVIAVLAKMVLDGGGGGGGSSSLVEQTFSLTSAEIKASTLTPHTIIAAQGAGTLIVPMMYVFDFDVNTTPYSVGPLELVYGDLNLNSLIQNFFDASYVGYVFHALSAGFAEGGAPADYLNKPVRLRAGLRGTITDISHTDFGVASAGYAVGDTGTIDFGAPLATYIVTSVDGSGAVTGLTVTSGGGDYNLGAAGAISVWSTTTGGAQPGVGTGLEVNVSEVDASGAVGDGTLTGSIFYVVRSRT